MKKIKILFTTSNFNTAGSGKVIYDLVNGLDKNAFEVEIACGSRGGDFFKTVESLGLPIHIVETKTSYRPYWTLPSRLLKISRFLKQQQYDIVHSWQWSNDWTETLAAKIAGIKWIYTKKAMGFHNLHWRIKSQLADYIITINDEMQQYFPQKKAQQLIPLGIDTEYYSPQHFTKEPSNRFEIITVANLVPVKGIEVLLYALKNLKNENIYLTILGDHQNEYGRQLEALCHKLGLTDQVRFLGKHLDVRLYVLASDLYVIPTLDKGRKEGMPMALVEAMSMGIPVLGSNISGIKFVLKAFPQLLFEAGNPDILSEKIREIQSMTSEERVQLGNNLRSYCIEHFTLTDFVNAHENLYAELLNV